MLKHVRQGCLKTACQLLTMASVVTTAPAAHAMFPKLPPEISEHVLSFLDIRDLQKVHRVSRDAHMAATNAGFRHFPQMIIRAKVDLNNRLTINAKNVAEDFGRIDQSLDQLLASPNDMLEDLPRQDLYKLLYIGALQRSANSLKIKIPNRLGFIRAAVADESLKAHDERLKQKLLNNRDKPFDLIVATKYRKLDAMVLTPFDQDNIYKESNENSVRKRLEEVRRCISSMPKLTVQERNQYLLTTREMIRYNNFLSQLIFCLSANVRNMIKLNQDLHPNSSQWMDMVQKSSILGHDLMVLKQAQLSLYRIVFSYQDMMRAYAQFMNKEWAQRIVQSAQQIQTVAHDDVQEVGRAKRQNKARRKDGVGVRVQRHDHYLQRNYERKKDQIKRSNKLGRQLRAN